VLNRLGAEREFKSLKVDIGADGRFTYVFDEGEDVVESLAAAE
jgi:hypothetical protein